MLQNLPILQKKIRKPKRLPKLLTGQVQIHQLPIHQLLIHQLLIHQQTINLLLTMRQTTAWRKMMRIYMTTKRATVKRTQKLRLHALK